MVKRRCRLNSVLSLVFLFCFSSVVYADLQTEQNLTCPSDSEINNEFTLRKDKLIKLKSSLENFIRGKKVNDLPLTSLFKVDINNTQAVTRRIDELKQELAKTQLDKTLDPYLSCAIAGDDLKTSAQEILALQRAVADLRLQFLTLPAKQASAILHSQIEAKAQAEALRQLQDEHASAINQQKEAAKSLARIEQQELTENSETADLVSALADVERVKSELAALQVTWLADLESEANFYHQTTEQLADISRFMLQPQMNTDLKLEYQKSVVIWRSLVDRTQKIVAGSHAVDLPELPKYPEQLLADSGQSEQAKNYINIYAETDHFRQELIEKITQKLQESIDLHYRVLLQSGDIRSQLLNRLLARGDRSPLAFSRSLLADVQREFSIVPYRWSATFYLRLLEIKQNLSSGWQGWAETAANLGLLVLFFLIPLVFWIINKNLSRQLSRLQIELVRQSRVRLRANYLALTIQKIQPYLSWVIMLVAIYLAQHLLANTVFSELILLLPYFRYYIYYRLFRQFMQCDFVWVNRQIKGAKLWELRRQVDVTARILGIAALVIFSLLTVIESLIRRGLIYHLVSQALLYLTVLIAMLFVYQWRRVIGAGLKKLLPEKLGNPIERFCNGKWGLLLSIPAFTLLIALLILKQLLKWGSHFELAKRIASELFRIRLETTINKSPLVSHFSPAPPEYKRYFSISGVNAQDALIKPNSINFSEIMQNFENWLSGASSLHSMAVIAHKGAGKTSLLDYIQNSVTQARIVRLNLTQKIITKEQLATVLNNALDSINQESLSNKTIVLIDDAHNLFISKQNGFSGYEALIDYMNDTPNIFWCLSFNYYAWKYLSSVYAKQAYFGSAVYLAPWTEASIKELIVFLHNKTNFRLSYDDILQAVGNHNDFEHITDIENRFFILLRQQSKGNPRLAVYLWLTSLRLVSDEVLHVGLPEEYEITALSELPEEALFLFANIARHENLTLLQAAETTQLPFSTIKFLLELGLRLGLLVCDEAQVYRLSILYQFPLTSYLLAKHYLYE